jgi:hypothetical protein
VWTKAEEHVVKIEKEYCEENCIDRSVIEPIIIDFCDDDLDDDAGSVPVYLFLFCVKLFCVLFICYNQYIS